MSSRRASSLALLLASTACAAVAACAGVLGLEDRTLLANDGGNDDGGNGDDRAGDDGASASDGSGNDVLVDAIDPPRQDAEAFDVGPIPDAGPDAPPAPCDGTSVPVYEFNGGDSRWRYSTSPTPESGETALGPLFKTFSTAYTGAKMTIYVIVNDGMLDTAVTYRADEGAGSGYTLKETIGDVNAKNASPPPGTLSLTRYYRESAPTRHRLFVNTSAATIGQWAIEPNVFYACPP